MKDRIEKTGLFCGPLPSELERLFNLYIQGNLTGLSLQEKDSSLHALNEFLAPYHLFDIDYAFQMERFRNHLEGLQDLSHQDRPSILVSLKSYRLQFTDPTNGTFTLHSEASVGVKLKDAIAYLQKCGIDIDEDQFLRRLSLGSIIWTDDERVKERLSALLKVRVLGGQIEEYQSYFRFGETTRNIWLIQNFCVKIHHKGDFRNLPFDCFPFEIKYSVGMGTDVVHTNLNIDACHKEPTTLFSYDFDAGEYEIDQKTAHLVPAGLLQDPTCYFENVAHLRFWVKRNGKPIVLRIILPLVFMVCMTLFGSIFITEPVAMVTQLIPSIFLAMVALQLTASYGMPRGAPFSRLDMLFVFSYSLLIILFMHYLLIGHFGILSILFISIFYFLGSWTLLRGKYRSWKIGKNKFHCR